MEKHRPMQLKIKQISGANQAIKALKKGEENENEIHRSGNDKSPSTSPRKKR